MWKDFWFAEITVRVPIIQWPHSSSSKLNEPHKHFEKQNRSLSTIDRPKNCRTLSRNEKKYRSCNERNGFPSAKQYRSSSNLCFGKRYLQVTSWFPNHWKKIKLIPKCNILIF